jgi:sulfite exporter TauE/SafE
MSAALLLSGMALGLASSLHCVGMCGPLVMAFPMQLMPDGKKGMGMLLYHAGRIGVYVSLGLIAGLVGWRLSIAGWQQALAIGMGLLLLLFVFIKPFAQQAKWPGWLQKQLHGIYAKAVQQPRLTTMIWLGMINGLLPCGMVYIAMAGALATGNLPEAGLFMFLFGTGTLPALLLLGIWGVKAGPRFRQIFRQAAPVLMGLTAILLILRGLNLGIPYISPLLSGRSAGTVSCH